MRIAGLSALLLLAMALTFHFGTTGTPPVVGFLNKHVDAIVLDSEVTTVGDDERAMVLVIYTQAGERKARPLSGVWIGPWWKGGLQRASDGVSVKGYEVGDTVTVRLPSHPSMRATHVTAAPFRWAGFLVGVLLGAASGLLLLRELLRWFTAPKAAPSA